MKKFLTIIIVLLAVFLIYLGFKDDKIYYLSLGDSLANGLNAYKSKDYGYADYVKDYLNKEGTLEVYVDGLVDNNKRATDIIQEINDNVEVNVGGKTKTLQNALIKADLVTISLGMNDLLNNLDFNNDFSINDLYSKLEQVSQDFTDLFDLMRKYCKEDIIFIGFYDPTFNPELNQFFEYANNKIKSIAYSYDIDYIDTYIDFRNSNYFSSTSSSFPNKEGYKLISDKIIALIEEDD